MATFAAGAAVLLPHRRVSPQIPFSLPFLQTLHPIDSFDSSLTSDLSDSSVNLQWAQGEAGEDRVHVEHDWIFVSIYDGFSGPDATDYLFAFISISVLLSLSSLLESQVNENQSVLHSFETTVDRLQTDIDCKDSEAAVQCCHCRPMVPHIQGKSFPAGGAILIACPLLEAFQIQGFIGVTRLDVSPKKLPKLASFALSESYVSPVTASIIAPNLTSILFVGDLNLLYWNGSPCLVDTTLRNITKVKSESCWMGLVSAISNVNIFTVNNLFYQFVIPRKFVNGIHDAMFKNLHELTCEIDWFTGSLLCSFISNIKECSLLESLCIRFNKDEVEGKEEDEKKLGLLLLQVFSLSLSLSLSFFLFL